MEDTPSRLGYPGAAPPVPARPDGLGGSLGSAHVSRTPTPNLDFVGMQEEIERAHARASEAGRETLAQIFPDMDGEVLDMVLEANGGDLGRSIEALLEMSTGD